MEFYITRDMLVTVIVFTYKMLQSTPLFFYEDNLSADLATEPDVLF